jgi:hypothetical protein
MTKAGLTTALLLMTLLTTGQDFEQLYKRIETFKTFSEFDSVDREILVVCDYVLSQPLMREKQTKNYYYAVKSMVKWMSNTESYRILLFGKVIESTQGDLLMQNMFMASMGKYLLNERYNNNRHVLPVKQPNINYSDLPEVKETLLEGAKIFFVYLKDVAGEKPNRELKNGIKALENGVLEEYMFKKT